MDRILASMCLFEIGPFSGENDRLSWNLGCNENQFVEPYGLGTYSVQTEWQTNPKFQVVFGCFWSIISINFMNSF